MTERQEIDLRVQLARAYKSYKNWDRASSRIISSTYSWTAEQDFMDKELIKLKGILVGIYGDK